MKESGLSSYQCLDNKMHLVFLVMALYPFRERVFIRTSIGEHAFSGSINGC